MRRWMILTLACLANCGVNGGENPAAGLVAHYRFAEGQGDRLLDHSGHQHHGRIIGARWEQAGGRWALRFNGNGDHVDFGDNRALKMNGDFTLLAWVTLDAPVYPDGNTNWTVFDCESYPNEGTILRVDGGATTVMFRSSRAGATPYQFGKARLANHGCYLIGVVRQGPRARIIVDGVADAEFACGGDPVYGQTSFKISSPSQSFAGLIHEARIYSRALTAGEIAGEYWRAAKIAGKDVSRLGTLALRGGVYADDPQVLAEVDFLGILPLADSERVVVSLVRGDGTVVREKAVESIPDACRGELALDMTGQPAGDYALTAAVRGQSGQPRAAASHVFAWPVSYAAKAPAPQTVVVPPLPAPRQRLQPQATVLPGGGIRVAVAGRQDRSQTLECGDSSPLWVSPSASRAAQRSAEKESGDESPHSKKIAANDRTSAHTSASYSIPIESSFSVPNGADRVLAAAAADDVRVAGSRVTLTTGHYRLNREVQTQPGRVLVRDTLTNLTARPVGIIFSHRLAVERAQVKQAYLAGYTVSPPVTRALKTNPTAFADLGGLGLGLVALDDVLIVQSQGGCIDNGLTLGSREFALGANASYTVEWAVYVIDPGDYYDLINDVRADEGRNGTTVQGTWVTPGALMSRRTKDSVPPPSYFDVRRPEYFCIPCLSWSTDDPTVSLEGIEFIEYPKERAAVRQVIDAVRAVRPKLKTMFHIAPNLYATNKPDARWFDSRLIGPDGKQTVYAYNYESGSYFTKERLAENWRWWSYYPAVDNAYGRALLDSVDVMMNEMGATGVFVDGALWDYGGGYSYDRFDGHTADIDPQAKTITRLKTAVPLLQQHAIAAWGRKIMERGGVVVANNAVPTRTFASQPFVFDREVSEGPEIHLLPTPCTLGNPAAIQGETDVYADVLAKLAWGNLYFYYGEPLGLQHELPPARMYPITVTDVRSGCVTGKERIVTMRNGVYGWPGERGLHLVYRYDRRGRRIGHDFVTTIDAAGARTAVKLDDGESAIVVKLPVTVESAAPVNAIVANCDERTIEVSLHGHGPVRITSPDGKTRELSLRGEQKLSIQPGVAE